jgi:hypothetical protein
MTEISSFNLFDNPGTTLWRVTFDGA